MAAFKGNWWEYSTLQSAVNDLITDHPRTNIASTTFASLPSAATAGAGARAFITDCTVATYNTAAAGGGANKVPVFSDGAAWKVG